MQITPNSVDFRDLATACAAATTSDETVAASLPALLELSGGTSGLLVRGRLDVSVVAARRGDPLDESVVGPLLEAAQSDRWTGGDVPAAWSESGVSELLFRRLPGHAGVIVLTRVGEPFPEWAESLDVATSFVEVAVARRQAEEQFADLTLRVNNAQQLADMGDYDWHIPSDTNRWSDQLFRIYGHEPQSFNATYERFLSLLHPDDRDRIMAVHQAAYGSGEPYQMIERIIRPDGEVRYLSSNGQVIMDAEGAPVRMRGTCIDITDTVLAEQEREHSAERFRALVESSPDAILVLDHGTIVQANGRADELLGGDPVGHRMDEITTLDVEPALGVDGRGLDGRPLELDISIARLSRVDDKPLMAVFLRDCTPRLASEALAAGMREAEVRRRQAIEINDNVVQGLAAATYSLESGQVPDAAAYVQLTLSAARRMMNDLMNPEEGDPARPGDLVRTTAATLASGAGDSASVDPDAVSAADAAETAERQHRILIADDSADIRTLLRLKLEAKNVGEVVGEATDGREAVEMATELQPDLVLLDLAMPRMDGLEALPLIMAAVPGVKVIVLSGFEQTGLADQALSSGASRYVVKGTALKELATIIELVLAEPLPPSAA